MDRQEATELINKLLDITSNLDDLDESLRIAEAGLGDTDLTEDEIDTLQQFIWEADYLTDTARRFLEG